MMSIQAHPGMTTSRSVIDVPVGCTRLAALLNLRPRSGREQTACATGWLVPVRSASDMTPEVPAGWNERRQRN